MKRKEENVDVENSSSSHTKMLKELDRWNRARCNQTFVLRNKKAGKSEMWPITDYQNPRLEYFLTIINYILFSDQANIKLTNWESKSAIL